jgi:glycosyltransferase involved in cell wall biosynthesis
MSLTHPKVSVVIPCYNDKEYIEETVQSVLDQTFQDFEIIIVDDGSDKGTKKVLFSLKNEKIQIITQINQGLSSARNNGIKEAKGDYILTLDSDDTFDSAFLEKAVVILDKHQNIGAVSSYCNIFIKNHQVVHKYSPKGGGVDNFLFDNNSVSFALIRKKCWKSVGGYDEQMKNGFEDWEFWIAMTKKGWLVFNIPDFLFNYRQKKQSMLKEAKMNYRESNLSYIYKKHQDLYQPHFEKVVDYLASLAERNKKNEIKYKNSIEFKVGRCMLFPINKINAIIKRKRL